MAADGRESRLRESLEALRRLGVAADGATVEALERALGDDPATTLAVADVLGRVASEESARLLATIEASAKDDKLVRREVRRSLYRLRQKGVEAAEAPQKEEVAPRPLLAGPEPEGFLSLSDPRGDRLLWILKPRAGGQLFHLSTVVNEPAGLREAVLAEVTRKSVRALRDQIAARHGLRMVEADWRYCDWIASEGYERAKAHGETSESVTQYPQLRLQLFTTAAKPADLPLPPGARSDQALGESAALLEEAELHHWLLTEQELASPLARYREIRDSPIVLDRSAQMGRIEEIVQAALEELFAGERATSWQRRLAEAALVFAADGRAPAAARAASVADALRDRGSGRGIPFCDQLVRRSLAGFFSREAEREKEEKQSSVLVTPDDIRAEQARARQRTPRGGR